MKYLALIVILLFSGYAIADSDDCSSSPKPMPSFGCANSDITCACDANGVCRWVENCN